MNKMIQKSIKINVDTIPSIQTGYTVNNMVICEKFGMFIETDNMTYIWTLRVLGLLDLEDIVRYNFYYPNYHYLKDIKVASFRVGYMLCGNYCTIICTPHLMKPPKIKDDEKTFIKKKCK